MYLAGGGGGIDGVISGLAARQLTVETGDPFDCKLTSVAGVCGDSLEVHSESLGQPVKHPKLGDETGLYSVSHKNLELDLNS